MSAERDDPQWKRLLNELERAIDSVVEKLERRDVETIPGAREALVNRLRAFQSVFPRNDGQVLKRLIHETIEARFFPRVNDVAVAFRKILASRTPEQDHVILELFSGFVISEKRGLGTSRQGTVIDKFVEALRKSNNFTVSDQQFYAMFGSFTKVRKYVREGLQWLVDLFGLTEREITIEKDLRTSGKKVVRFFTFPEHLLEVLDGKYIERNPETGKVVVLPSFDKTVLVSLLLANWSVNRATLTKQTINGVCDLLTLVLLVGSLPALKLDENHPLTHEATYDPSRMSVIPKSWMMREVMGDLFTPLVRVVARLLGGSQWVSKIEVSDVRKNLHEQARFLLQDVNRWVLGNLCRVEIPVFVEISNLFAEVLVGVSSEEV
ncbi:MAG: hypothetical protein Kow0069_00860 [Promethearchaeota archaeon]